MRLQIVAICPENFALIRAGFEPQVKRYYKLANGQRLECMFMIKSVNRHKDAVA